jgi:hypothetical protein
MGSMMLAKNPTESSTTPLYTPAILAVISGMRAGRDGLRRACGAGIIRGSRHNMDAVIDWECSAMLLSPITASSVTTSNRHPLESFCPTGNHSVIPPAVDPASPDDDDVSVIALSVIDVKMMKMQGSWIVMSRALCSRLVSLSWA